ncbi:hypothetical protein [Terricaulis silvestris]|uniref:Uncharacterized protein n=1 Tax=Terricaulis silvestris TaxID=2686094 RepID=A0A6I6MJZ3_9CAUL|nr:hypothetical protein [Terricaulis silvestris]QGZ93508.1 hypothetical protein DSM104635_00319 [Terricaulis silvestris]
MSDRFEIPSRMTCGVKIEFPESFFRWTILPYAHCFAIAAFAFHVEHGYRRNELLRPKLDDPSDPGIRNWFGLEAHRLNISSFYGALRIEDPSEPFQELSINDEGDLHSVPSFLPGVMFPEEERTRVFDESFPIARTKVKHMLEHSIIIGALDVKGRRESALAKKEQIEWGCFTAGLEWDRHRCLFNLDGAKLYDVELRVSPRVKPEDVDVQQITEEPKARSAKRAGIKDAVNQVWPEGIPKGLTIKERDGAIMAFLERNGVTAPSAKTIQRALKD